MHELVIVVAKYFLAFSVVIAFWAFVEQPMKKKKEFVMLGVTGGLLALLLAFIGAHLYYNPRPFVVGHFAPYFPHGNDNGFPSDHTLLASFLMFLVWRYSRKFGAALLVLALMIGFARVAAGIHHTIDIAGSFAFSALGFSLALLTLNACRKSKLVRNFLK